MTKCPPVELNNQQKVLILVGSGIPERQTAEALGMSKQRVTQIVLQAGLREPEIGGRPLGVRDSAPRKKHSSPKLSVTGN
jgi:hypothetical protein